VLAQPLRAPAEGSVLAGAAMGIGQPYVFHDNHWGVFVRKMPMIMIPMVAVAAIIAMAMMSGRPDKMAQRMGKSM
jgi:hypothetical protein